MVKFIATIQKFEQQGEKTGWSFIEIPPAIARQLKPANKKAFRVKGKLDNCNIEYTALLPMGDGNFIMALNATVRRMLKKEKGARLKVELQIDPRTIQICSLLTDCLEDAPEARRFFDTLPPSHQSYFSKWIESAKTEQTQTKRLTQTINALSKKQRYNIMIRSLNNKL